MSVMLLPEFIDALPVIRENAYVVAITGEGITVGSVFVYDVDQISIAVWGNDSQSSQVDGALAEEAIMLQFVDGEDLYNLSITEDILYVTNSIITLNSVSANSIDCSIVPGCTQEWADNFNVLASEDDGSCYLYGCLDTLAFNYNQNVTIEDSSCLFSQSYTYALEQLVDTNHTVIVNLENQLSGALANQDDGVSQADLDVLQTQLDTLQVQLSELAANSLDGQVLYFENQIDLENPSQYEVVVQAYSTLAQAYKQCKPNVYGQITVSLQESWNTIGYNLVYETTPQYQFATILDDLILVKDNRGEIYWPLYNFNGIGNLIPGQGYQLRMINTREFVFQE